MGKPVREFVIILKKHPFRHRELRFLKKVKREDVYLYPDKMNKVVKIRVNDLVVTESNLIFFIWSIKVFLLAHWSI